MTRLLYVLDSATADDARLFADRLGYLSSELTREILDWVEQFDCQPTDPEKGWSSDELQEISRGRVQRAGSRHATARAMADTMREAAALLRRLEPTTPKARRPRDG